MPRRPDVKTARKELDAERRKLEADGLPHSDPHSIDQDLEDSFPASDPPSYTASRTVGTPKNHKKSEQPDTEPGGLAAGPGTLGKKDDHKAQPSAHK